MKKLLTESKNYKVIGEYETVYLIDKMTGKDTIIGDFYGDPVGGIIDTNEQLAIMYGCGIIVYFLREPFEQYSYSTRSAQWSDIGRDEPEMWIENVCQLDNCKFEIEFEDGSKKLLCVEGNNCSVCGKE